MAIKNQNQVQKDEPSGKQEAPETDSPAPETSTAFHLLLSPLKNRRARPNLQVLTPPNVLQLQRTIGNKATIGQLNLRKNFRASPVPAEPSDSAIERNYDGDAAPGTKLWFLVGGVYKQVAILRESTTVKGLITVFEVDEAGKQTSLLQRADRSQLFVSKPADAITPPTPTTPTTPTPPVTAATTGPVADKPAATSPVVVPTAVTTPPTGAVTQTPPLPSKPSVVPDAEPDSVEVRKKINKIGVANASGSGIVLPETGAYDEALRNAVKDFQKSRGLAVDGLVNKDTAAALNATVTNSKGTETRNVGGVDYDGRWNYDWQVTDNQVHVTVKINFTGNTPGKGAAVSKWIGYIQDVWNKFKVVEKTSGKKLDIYFDPISVGGGEHTSVEVAPGTGRSNAAKWYITDAGGEASVKKVVAHEFGHLVSLPDEYQLSHERFQAVTGKAPAEGAKVASDGATAETVADEMTAALKTAVEGDRVTAVKKVISDHGLKQGNFTEAVVTKYKEKNPTSPGLVRDLAAKIPPASQWRIIDVFTHSGGGTMGNFFVGDNAVDAADASGHDHPLGPRHMKPFVGHAKASKGGDWEAQFK